MQEVSQLASAAVPSYTGQQDCEEEEGDREWEQGHKEEEEEHHAQRKEHSPVRQKELAVQEEQRDYAHLEQPERR